MPSPPITAPRNSPRRPWISPPPPRSGRGRPRLTGIAAEIAVFPGPAELAEAAAGFFAREAAARLKSARRFTAALAGGATPRETYAALAGPPFGESIDWPRVHLFWGDERMVPPDHLDSGYRMAWEAWISKVSLPEKNVHPVHTEGVSARTAAAEYDRHLREFFHLGRGGWPTFDLVLLGLGEDGHIASLFPESPVLEERDRVVMASRHPRTAQERVTITLPVVNEARCTAFLVSGESKAGIVRQIIEGRAPDLPAARVRPFKGRLVWLLDEAAASRLSPSFRPRAEKES